MKIITKTYLLLLVLLLACSCTSAGQNVPPTYWENYMSFKIGNYFEYEYNGGLYRYSRRIVGDTIVQSNGQHYYKIEFISPIPNPPSYQFERIDSSGDWYIYFTGVQQQCLLYRLNVPLGTAFLDGCGGVNPVILQDTFSLNTILGNTGPFFVRKYYYQSMAPGDYYIARKFQNYYWYNYEGGNYANLVGAIIDSIIYGSISGISITHSEISSDYKIFQNYPNPFNPKTMIKFSVPERSFIRLVVIDAIGRDVEILYDGYANLGEYQVEFNGSDLSTGVYFYKLQSSNYSKTMKMVLIK